MSYGRKITASFVCAMTVLIAVAISVYTSFSQMTYENQRVEHTYKVIAELQLVLSELKDAQSAVRGYVITGQEEYLTPYYVSIPRIEEHLISLERLISDNPVQIKRMGHLKNRTADRLQIARDVTEAYNKEGEEAAAAMIKQGSGKREMDEIRVLINDMSTQEQHLLDIRRNSVELSLRLTIILGVLGLIICFSILSAVFFLIRRETTRREQTEAELKTAFDDVDIAHKETQIISKMGDYLRSCRDKNEAYDMVRLNMPQLFPDTYGAIFSFNNSRDHMNEAAVWGAESHFEEFEPNACWALRQGRSHESSKDSSVPVCPHLLNQEGKTICVPIQASGNVFGQLTIASEDKTAFTEQRQTTIRTVAEQISMALANLNLQDALKEQSIRDPLTKLFNRRYLEETLVREFSRIKRNNQTLSVLLMDIDFFKKVNDTYGHDAGDAVLIEFSRLLQKKIRKEDMACRMGGEEFVLVLPTASLELAVKRAEEICEELRGIELKTGNDTIKVTVSIGVASIPSHASTPEDLLKVADTALYSAKKSGRDRVVVSSPRD